MFVAALVALLSAAVVAYAVHWWSFRSNVRGPRGYPLVGNLPELRRNVPRVLDWALDNAMTHGLVWRANLPFFPPVFIVSDPAAAEHILRTKFDNYVKGAVVHRIGETLLGDGIFNVDGELWREQRKTASHLVSARAIGEMVPVFVHHAQAMAKMLVAAARDGREVDVQHLFFCSTLDCICEIAMGRDIRSIDGLDGGFAAAFDKAQQLTEERFFWPLWRWMPQGKLRAAVDHLSSFAYKMVDERKALLEKHKVRASDKLEDILTGRPDLLTRFIHKRAPNGEPFSDEYLRDIVMNLVIAGRDTTAQTLTWATYLLSQNPDKEAKLVSEIEAVLADGPLTMRSAERLVYTKAVIDETLRLYPPVPLDPKTAVEADMLPGGERIPRGSIVVWSAWCLGRHPKLWREPERFLPERFLDMADTHGPVHPYAFIPFQEGPRRCLGREMAYLEARIMLATVYSAVHLELRPGHHVTYLKPAITLPVKGGLPMTARVRRA